MKKNKRHLYKRLPKYALGTMKPIDLGYQPGRGIGSARFETELNMSLDPETLAIRRSYIPNAVGKLTQYSPYVTEAVKDWTSGSSAASTATPRIGAVKPAGVSRVSPMSSQPAINTTSSVVPQMNIPGSTSNAVSSTAGSLTSRLSNIAAPYIDANALSLIASNAGSTASSVGNSLTNALSSTLTNGATSASNALLSSSASTMANTVAQTGGQLLSASAQEAVNKAVEQSLQTSPTKSGVLGVAGKVAAGLGAAIGAYNMFNDITGFGNHRSASDMLANVGRSHVTTDYGNQYTTYNGVNTGQELAYEKANARSKQLGFGMNAIGTGASIGSFFGPIGTGIGAAAGLLLGGLGSLFGWGDNSEEIERLTRLTNDNIANYNRQGEAVARSKDVAAEFNDRQGVASAAEGKSAYGPMKYMNSKLGMNLLQGPEGATIGKPTSLLTPGEYTYDPINKTGKKVVGKGDGDTVPSYIEPNDQNIVFSKKLGFAKHAAPMIEEIEKLNKIIANAGGSKEQKELQISQAKQRQDLLNDKLLQLSDLLNIKRDMKKYNCGKLPGFAPGKSGWVDYLMTGVPHLAALGASWNLYNRAKYADMPDYPNIVDSSANTKAINILSQRKFRVDPILDQLYNTYRGSLYDINRTPGLTAGGLVVARANAAAQLNKQKTAAMVQADEINNRYTADYANALANYGKWMSEMMTNNNYARAAFRQLQNAAKEGWMAQYEKNGLTALADLASDIMGVRQFNRSEDYQDKMLELYDRQVKNDTYKVFADYLNRQNDKPTTKYIYPSLLLQAAYATVGRTPQEAVFSSIPRSIKIRGLKS